MNHYRHRNTMAILALSAAGVACGGDTGGDALVYCACSWGIPQEAGNQTIPSEVPIIGEVPVIGGTTIPGTLGTFNSGIQVCLQEPSSDPVATQDYFSGRCQEVCGSRLGWNRFAQKIGQCLDGEPFGSQTQPFSLAPTELVNGDRYSVSGTLEIIRGPGPGETGTSQASGVVELKNADCTAPCTIELAYLSLVGTDTTVSGHAVTEVRANLRERISGAKDTNGVVTFPAGAFRANAEASIGGIQRPQLLETDQPVVLSPSASGGWSMSGSGSGPDGNLTFSLSLAVDNRAPHAVLLGTTDVSCDPEVGTGLIELSSSGSFDPDGDSLGVYWSSANAPVSYDVEYIAELGVGDYDLRLFVSDGTKFDMELTSLSVVDDTPTPLSPPAATVLQSCGGGSEVVAFPPPESTDLCSEPDVSGEVVAIDGAPMGPIALVSGRASVPPGVVTVLWRATKPNGLVSMLEVDYTVIGRPVLRAGEVWLSDRSEILSSGGVRGFVAADDVNGIEVGADAVTGTLFSAGDVFARERASIGGDIFLTGQYTHQNMVTVSGNVVQGTFLSGATPTFQVGLIPTGSHVNLEPDQQLTIGPGAYGSLSVKSRATLTLSAGEYAFSSIQVEPQASLVLLGATRVAVHGNVTFRGAASGAVPTFEVHGQRYVYLEQSIAAALVAPDSSVTLGPTSGGAAFEGEFLGETILVRPDVDIQHVSLTCGQ